MGKIERLLEKLRNNPKKLIAVVGLAALVATTSINDNVHFGSVTLNNPQENHYTWGLMPTTEIKGNAEGNFYTIGLFAGINILGDKSSITGDMEAYGSFAGINILGDKSSITGDMKGYGLLIGGNKVGSEFSITGDMKGYGLFIGINKLGEGSSITGDVSSKGMLALAPTSWSIGSNVEIGLDDYTVKKERE